MKKLRIILLSILIPLFIIVAVFFYAYNSMQNQIFRKAQDIVKSQDALYKNLEVLSNMDAERFNYENLQLKKLMAQKKFSLKDIDINGISKLDKKILGEVEIFKDKIRSCRDQIELFSLEEDKYTEKYNDLTEKCNKSLNLLTYFAVNYEQAINMNEYIMENFEKFALSENQEYFLRPMERYYRQAKAFKNLFALNHPKVNYAFKKLKNPGEKEIAAAKPREDDAKKTLDQILAQKQTIAAYVKDDLDSDTIDELAVLTLTKDGNILKIYDFKNNAYEFLWESPPIKGKQEKLVIRHLGLIPEVVITPQGKSFKSGGAVFIDTTF